MIILTLATLAFLLLAVALLLLWRTHQAERDQAFFLQHRLGEAGTLDGAAARPQKDALTQVIEGFVLRAGVDLEHLPGWFGPASLVSVGAMVVLGVLFGLTFALIGLVVYMVAVILWALAREMQRQNKMREQLPNFLEHMMRILNAGNSLEEALSGATDECPEPLADVFRRVSRQVRLGAPIEETLTEVALLSGMRELQVMALATQINRRFGGSLKRIFKSLVAAIHQQDAARREMRALTAETRFSAVVLAIVPIGMMLYILSQNPDYYTQMWNDGGGRSLLLAAVGLQLLGVVIIWRMVNRAGREAG
ncbi:MAG: type II secretion system F family protein [Oceanococcaceae bacterium]